MMASLELKQHHRPLMGTVHFMSAVHPLPVSQRFTPEDLSFNPVPGDIVWRYADSPIGATYQFGLVVARWHGVAHSLAWREMGPMQLIEVLWSPTG